MPLVRKHGRVRRKGEREWCATERAAKRQGMEDSPRSASSGEGEVERVVTLPPLSSPCMTPSPHREAVPLQTGSIAGERRPKWPLAEGEVPTDSFRQLFPA
jgi:hypothetical protein